MTTSGLPGVHNLTRRERLAPVADTAGLEAADRAQLEAASAHDGHLADHPGENVISVMAVPPGIATDLTVDGAGAVSLMAPKDRPHGDRMAGVRDPCGNIWWVAAHGG